MRDFLINKKVKFINFDTNRNHSKIVGIVIDKYRGITTINQKYPTVQGGHTTLETKISSDFYLIISNDKLYHIECDKVFQLIT